MAITRHFWGWDGPVVAQAAAWLTHSLTHAPADLSDWLLVVPTRHAGRRLRQYLAAHCSERFGGLLAPRVWTPERFFTPAETADRIASRGEALATLAALVRATPGDYPHLFPVPPVDTGFRWGLGVATKLLDLFAALTENGWTVRSALDQLGADFEEAARWEELADLERRFHSALTAAGCRDANTAKREAARQPQLPDGVQRIALLAVPDPVPLAVSALTRLAHTVPIDVCIQAPAELTERFDAWGRPLTDAWLERDIPLADDWIRLVAKPQDQAEEVARVLDGGTAVADLAIGVPDEDVLPHLERLLARRGIVVFNPAGEPLSRHTLFHLVKELGLLATGGEYAAVRSLLRNPDLLEFLHHGWLGPGHFDSARLLARLDRFQNEHLPATFGALTALLANSAPPAATAPALDGEAELRFACRELEHLSDHLTRGAWPDALLEILGKIYAPRRLQPQLEADRVFADVAGTVTELLQELNGELFTRHCPGLADKLDILLRLLAAQNCYPEAPREHAEAEGWLELLWNDAPHLVLTGFNEGKAPESVVGHTFLPDNLRRRLGLLHNDQRFARDNYLLSAMLASRARPDTSLRIVVGKSSTEGDALKPSRLLFRCPPDVLPQRALRLFAEVQESRPALPRQRAWKLRPPLRPAPEALSVTALRTYLSCPFRFYLNHVLAMEELDDRKAELDARDFGNLCHHALQAFALHPALRLASDPDAIADFLITEVEAQIARAFGKAPSTLVLIQADAAKQRLRAAARVQAELRADGWEILPEYVEHRLGDRAGVLWNGIRLRGKVDRVDRHADGRLRIIDYKTGDKAKTPAEEHLAAAAADTPEFARVRLASGKPRQWTDLQLPLYRLLLAETLEQKAEIGYFNLPKAVTETGYAPWQDFTADLEQSATACAAAVIEAIRNRRFWPPRDKIRYDDCARLFFDTAGDSVEPQEDWSSDRV